MTQSILRKQIIQAAYHICFTTSLLLSLALLAGEERLAAANLAQGNTAKEVGLVKGEIAPHFHAMDQFGKEQTDTSVAGRNGMVLLFFRSADW